MTGLQPGDAWAPLRRLTPARIGLGRTGDALPTGDILRFQAAHASARDAVHAPLDVPHLADAIRDLGIAEPHVVPSLARDRAEYLRRPDLGRRTADLSALPTGPYDLAFVLADGLSTAALRHHGAALLRVLIGSLAADHSLAPPVIALQSRVAIGDVIGAHLRATTVLVLIGERPGLSVSDSLGVYLTHLPRPGRTDAERNCVSNIHANGLSYQQAGSVITALVAGANRLGRSGVALKDDTLAVDGG
ncbi:ethanolamine ammonia-lyase subunit EutC [Actinoplanes sp. NPDC026619]|uniref:ethanolamine ammonia-lyase subunit EutC n=1 Tax=Actinoplanes sp. NPDC026619 TaxID=3155798 RepID=UPI0033FF9D27